MEIINPIYNCAIITISPNESCLSFEEVNQRLTIYNEHLSVYLVAVCGNYCVGKALIRYKMARGIWIFAVCLLVTGLSLCNAEQQQLAPLKRSVRSAMQGLSSIMYEKVKNTVVRECMENGYQNGDDLKETIDQAKECLKNKKMFITPKAAFLDHVDSCTQEAVRKVRNCMPDDRKYFPEFIQDLMKSVVSMMYEDFDIMRVDLAACAPSLVQTSKQLEYINCLKKVSKETEDEDNIPSSRAAFCKRYLPATECFVKWVKSSCPDSENLRKFREDYYAASERPCEVKEVNSV
ncbi:unnamed protein product [Acanthoscelides obtectus]|uniref:Uncharacterized protein n=1 Tax=Acanthoscelides obtectus TaxID=200917 RepID=A0A9P0LFM7_ACAOB|nr:unnamed protein product [Acanthoscelides obtectus]CAK1624848.1 hypothetical protein AOBTE_LOCUS2797 [Acanthoscelides obtectus]